MWADLPKGAAALCPIWPHATAAVFPNRPQCVGQVYRLSQDRPHLFDRATEMTLCRGRGQMASIFLLTAVRPRCMVVVAVRSLVCEMSLSIQFGLAESS